MSQPLVDALRRYPRRLVAVAAMLAASVVTPVATATAHGPGDPGYNGAPRQDSGGPVPTLDGVPCVASNLGVCSSIAQNRPGRSEPRSTVGSSPTVVR